MINSSRNLLESGPHESPQYVLFTPVRDEEAVLPTLARAIASQTVRPALWLIVDDGSVDSTPEIICKLMDEWDWIVSTRTPRAQRDLDTRFARIVRDGFEQLLLESAVRGLAPKYIAKADADIIPSATCFEHLLDALERDTQIGIISPHLSRSTGRDRYVLSNDPTDGIRAYTIQCYLDVGGMPLVDAPDNAVQAKARIRGWRTVRLSGVEATKLRETSGAGGTWQGQWLQGYRRYFLDYHPLLLLFVFFYELTRPPFYPALALLLGYIRSATRHQPKISDPDIRAYFRHRRLYEIGSGLLQSTRTRMALHSSRIPNAYPLNPAAARGSDALGGGTLGTSADTASSSFYPLQDQQRPTT